MNQRHVEKVQQGGRLLKSRMRRDTDKTDPVFFSESNGGAASCLGKWNTRAAGSAYRHERIIHCSCMDAISNTPHHSDMRLHRCSKSTLFNIQSIVHRRSTHSLLLHGCNIKHASPLRYETTPLQQIHIVQYPVDSPSSLHSLRCTDN
jgi:hypothetical protein